MAVSRRPSPLKNAPPKVELLAPAGNFEKLEVAVHYGADAVYLGGKDFSLRSYSGNFTPSEIQAAVSMAHRHGVRVYVACNIYARNADQDAIAAFLETLGSIAPDAVIVSDPGVLALARECIPHIPIHLSTQANTTNFNAVRFWERMGATRINMARELTLQEIQTIAAQSSVALEGFVHGAMCMAYSGRCLMSSFMAGRESNQGMCCHPCRFKYTVMEETRPGQYLPLAQDDRGTYLFSALDLCMIEHIPEMIAAGLGALKIEGRMKGIHYLATVVNVYRQALDTYMQDPAGYRLNPVWVSELAKISHRPYGTGFYFKSAHADAVNLEGKRVPGHTFLGKVVSRTKAGQTWVEVRNQFHPGVGIEVIRPGQLTQPDHIAVMRDADQQPLPVAQPGMQVLVELEHPCAPYDLIRRRD